ncbi:MAG: hypothetical protein K0S07_1425 [Chlamydiales bacterium]|jgi:hypothetical protein|nr:hypothetical protein [Chlamydiales bacterium]
MDICGSRKATDCPFSHQEELLGKGNVSSSPYGSLAFISAVAAPVFKLLGALCLALSPACAPLLFLGAAAYTAAVGCLALSTLFLGLKIWRDYQEMSSSLELSCKSI